MPTTIKLRNSVTTTSAPSSLVQGEVAINITDKKVWVGNAATTPIQLLGDGGSGSFTSIAFGAGTVSSPSITFTGDTNTGIYSPAADTIAFTEGGVESMRIDSSGNVGIGRTAASGIRLDVENSADVYAAFRKTGGVTLQLYGSTSDAWVYNVTNHPLILGTNNTERMRIDSAGSVGIGTVPSAWSGSGADVLQNDRLSLAGAAGNSYFSNNWYTDGSSNRYIATGPASQMRMADDTIIFNRATSGTAGNTFSWSESMRIDSSGNVGIGTSSFVWSNAGRGLLEINGSTDSLIGLKSNNTTQMYMFASTSIAQINATANIPMAFYTNGTERMRITSGGDLLVGTTSNPAKITTNGNMMINAGGYNSALGTGLTINAGGYNDTTSKARVVHVGGLGDNNNRCGWTAYSIKTGGVGNGAEYYIRPVIWNGSAFTEQGSAGVYLTDNATSWTSASDERLKENLEPIANAVEKVKTIRAVTGKYKADTDGTSRAFLIAQDVQAVLPEAVTENSEGYLGLAYTETIPLLVAAIKEQQAMIEELKQEVAKLKGV